jgi:hypothetical protein
MWKLSQNSKNFLPVNWDPLSVMMELGTPKRWMISVKNVTAYSALRFVMGRTSTHLENLSIATNKWVKPPGHVRLLVVPTGHMIELEVVELVLEGSYGLAIRLHFVIVAARILHDLVNHELRIPPHVEALDAYLDGDLEAAEEGLVLSHIV